MPVYEVTAPDGRKLRITAPEGATQEDALAYAQQHLGQAPAPRRPMADRYAAAGIEAPKPAADVARAEYDAAPWYQKPAIAAGAELTSLGRGLGQLFTANDSTAHQKLTAAANADAPYQDAPHGVSGFVGRAAPYLATLPLGSPAAGTAGRLGLATAEGAAIGGAQQVRTGESRMQNAAFGGGLSALGFGLGAGARRAGKNASESIAPEVRAIWNKAKEFGITLTPAQLSDSRLMKYMSHQFGMLPFSGGAARTEQQVGQFNRKLSEAIGVDAPTVTPEVYASKKAADSAKFTELTDRNNLQMTGGLVQRLQDIVKEADIAGVGDRARKAVEGLYSQMDENGVVPGRAYQALDSVLGQATKSVDTAAHFVGRIRGAIRDAMDESISPEDSAAWRKLRQEYGNRKTIAPLVAKSDGGPLPPAQVMGRVTATKSGKERMASNRGGVMGDLARVGQAMKPPPSSGTAERTLVNQLVQPWQWPGLAFGATAGRATNSPLLAQLMMREGRGQGAQRLGRNLQQVSPLLALLMGQQQPADAGNGP
jgi:hypothetical protein